MLVTHRQHELIRHAFYVEPEEKIWRAVTLELSGDYFLVSYEDLNDLVPVRQRVMLWKVGDVLDFCSSLHADPTKKLTQLSVLTPSLSRRAEKWAIRSVKEIWILRDPQTKQEHVDYLTDKGTWGRQQQDKSDYGYERLERLLSVDGRDFGNSA